MKLFKKLGFIVLTLALSLGFAACSGGSKQGDELTKEYACSSVIFNLDYSGAYYELVDLDVDVYVNEVKAKNLTVKESAGNINFEVGGLPSLASVKIYLSQTRNSTPVDSSKSYSSSIHPEFFVTRYYTNGTFDNGGVLDLGTTTQTYTHDNIEEHIINYSEIIFTMDLDDEGFVL